MSRAATEVTVTSAPVSLESLVAVADGATVTIAADARERMRAGREVLDSAIADGRPVYGVTTGVGHARDDAVPAAAVHAMQARLLDLHAGALGPGLPTAVVRAAMAARLVGMTRGGSGATPEVADALAGLLNADVVPFVPETGSVGAGDLGQHALVGLVATGTGRVQVGDRLVPAARVLADAGLAPLTLGAKDGLALISANGVTLGHGALVLRTAQRALEAADVVAAVSLDAVSGNPSVLASVVQAAKGSPGQERSAARMRRVLHGSGRTAEARSVQDPLSFRVVPQVHGACADVLGRTVEATTTELNAMADNPLVSPDTGEVLSNGNFHPVLVALGFESLRLALVHVAQLSERRTGQLWESAVKALGTAPFVDPKGLPPWSAGLRLRYAAAARYTRARQLADPVTLDVPPLDLGQEDHSTNAPEAVRCTQEALDVLADLLAVEVLTALAVVGTTPTPSLGAGTQRLVDAVTRAVDVLGPGAPAHAAHAAVRDGLLTSVAAALGSDADPP